MTDQLLLGFDLLSFIPCFVVMIIIQTDQTCLYLQRDSKVKGLQCFNYLIGRVGCQVTAPRWPMISDTCTYCLLFAYSVIYQHDTKHKGQGEFWILCDTDSRPSLSTSAYTLISYFKISNQEGPLHSEDVGMVNGSLREEPSVYTVT